MSSRRMMRRGLSLLLAAPLILALGAIASWALPRDALRHTVQLCAAMMSATHLPLPCSGFTGQPPFRMAILDPPVPGKHRLVVPVAPVTGVEDPTLAGAAGAAYFATAWQVALDQAGGRWASSGLAVNSARVRTQDQLHFHADCLNPAARAYLQRLHGGPHWRRQGNMWMVAVSAPLAEVNPFALIRRVPEFARQVSDVNIGIFGLDAPRPTVLILATLRERSFERFLSSCRSVADAAR